MKRILILILCFAMLFCFGCKQSDPPKQENSEGEWGVFYNKDGYVHNTLITVVLNTTDHLTAPVTKLSYTLYDNSDFGITVDYYTDTNDHRTHRLEIFENGEWVEAPYNGTHMTLLSMGSLPDADPTAHRKFDLTMQLQHLENDQGAPIRYEPLQSGAYRLIVTYTLNTDDPNVTIPKRAHGCVLYFNVL